MKIPGKPVRILSLSSKKKGTFKLHEGALANILLKKEVKDKNVVVISIVGPSRKGKSFLMNFLLRYMTAVYVNYDPDWLVDDESPLEGFVWSGGSGKVTLGMDMWSEPFLVKLSYHQELAVFFLDTQGTFDQENSLIEDTAIFALSTLCSSVLIYNISCDILSIDLMHLELFLNYGLEAVSYDRDMGPTSCRVKPFHKLLFLIRDYAFSNAYGEEEGRKHLIKRLTTDNKETKKIVSNIMRCFSDVTCFLLPPVGFKTSVNKNCTGNIKDIDETFIDHLKLLAPSLLSPGNLVMKEITGDLITAKQLLICLKTYSNIFNSGILPQPKSIFEATVEVNNLMAVDKAKELYSKLMEEDFGPRNPYSAPSKLEVKHMQAKAIAVDKFRGVIKMGHERHSRPYEEKLVRDLDKMAISFRRYNNRKNMARTLRIPLIFLVVALLCYIFSNVFSIFKQKRLASSCKVVMALSVATLVLMLFVKIQQIIGE